MGMAAEQLAVMVDCRQSSRQEEWFVDAGVAAEQLAVTVDCRQEWFVDVGVAAVVDCKQSSYH